MPQADNAASVDPLDGLRLRGNLIYLVFGNEHHRLRRAGEHRRDVVSAASVYDLMLDEKIVSTYDTKLEAERALLWYVETHGQPNGSLYVQENREADI